MRDPTHPRKEIPVHKTWLINEIHLHSPDRGTAAIMEVPRMSPIRPGEGI